MGSAKIALYSKALCCAVIVLAIGSVQPAGAASLLSISGDSVVTIPSNNNLIPTTGTAFEALVPGGGVIVDSDNSGMVPGGAAMFSTTAPNVSLNYNYIGAFAAATNTFSTSGGSFVTTGVPEPVGDSTAQPAFDVLQASVGEIQFDFSSTAGDDNTFWVAYLEATNDTPGDFVWEITDTPTNVALILFDDIFPTGDRDFDDLGVVVVATPIPAALPLFTGAIVGLGLIGWRRKARS